MKNIKTKGHNCLTLSIQRKFASKSWRRNCQEHKSLRLLIDWRVIFLFIFIVFKVYKFNCSKKKSNLCQWMSVLECTHAKGRALLPPTRSNLISDVIKKIYLSTQPRECWILENRHPLTWMWLGHMSFLWREGSSCIIQ